MITVGVVLGVGVVAGTGRPSFPTGGRVTPFVYWHAVKDDQGAQ
jgi:hypothetical protein